MSDILTKKIYSKNKDTGVETQVYPETNPSSIVGLGDYVDGKIATAINSIDSFATPAEVQSSISTAISGLNIGSDNIATLSDFDFNNAGSLGNGTYIVINAVNSPFIGESTGILKVLTTTDNKKIHTWNGKRFTAYREFGTFNPLEAGVECLTINGNAVSTAVTAKPTAYGTKVVASFTDSDVPYRFTIEPVDNSTNGNTEKVLWLKSGGTYTLSGVLLNCQIRIGYPSKWVKSSGKLDAGKIDAATDEQRTTTIILNNFYVKMTNKIEYDVGDADEAEKAVKSCEPIIYSDVVGDTSVGKLIIKLTENTKNYLYRELQYGMETYNHSTGVIYTECNCVIEGPGSLGIKSMMGGHAIKSKLGLTIKDAPHIKGEVYHDILHGNGFVHYESGYTQAVYCNDIFGTDTTRGDGDIGKIRVYSGLFDIRECFGTFMQADDAIVYPSVKINFNTIGEGLWLQCAPGKVKGFGTKGNLDSIGVIEFSTESGARCLYNKRVLGDDTIDPLAIDISLYTPTVNDVYTGDPGVLTGITLGDDSQTVYALKLKDGVNVKSIVDRPMPGIIVYDGVEVTHDQEYSYTESSRNTHVSAFENSNTSITTYNLEFASTATSVSPANGELTLAEAAEFGSFVLADAHFDDINFTYASQLSGGVWNIGVTEFGLAEYKSGVDQIIKSVSSMIVPPKTVFIKSVQSGTFSSGVYTESATDPTMLTADVEIKKDTSYNGYTVLKAVGVGDYVFSSKSGIEYDITMQVGDCVKIIADIDPEDATNTQLKWGVVGISEETVFGRVKSNDTTYCWIRALQCGDEDMVVSAKALNKDYDKLATTIHVHVVEPAAQILGRAKTTSALSETTTYTVSFDAGDGEGSMDSVQTSGSYVLPVCLFTPNPEDVAEWDGNYVFNGWSIDGNNMMLPPGVVINVNANTTLTAQWGPELPPEPQSVSGN